MNVGNIMRAVLVLVTLSVAVQAQPSRYQLRGRLVPETSASVWLNGATSPFEDSTLAGEDGRFRFEQLPAGAYTLGVFVPGRGEMRQTIDVGPSMADSKGRIELRVDLRDELFEARDGLRRGALVSAGELAIPEQARREFEQARKKLAKRNGRNENDVPDVQAAVAHLQRAVEIAPRFAGAWNYLGTIAYQTHDYARAESCFRSALAADPDAFEPLVNLGGVLVNLQKLDEALPYNRHAALTRPGDALANSQLGMNYFYLGKLDLGQKYLTVAAKLDPGHFSHPQLLLAEIYYRRQERSAAADELAEFLRYHPDWPEAARINARIAWLRAP
jgi:tetratricopeptide (TPR) repeat protein